MDYHCCNRPIMWEDEYGTQEGFYHPMDLLHSVVKNLEIPLRSKLYRKFSDCKLAVPVVLPGDEGIYMDMSLRSIKVTWLSENQLVESDVTTAQLPIVSMIRCGKQSDDTISKSKLANAILDFSTNEKIGSCGFFRKTSLSNNNHREVSAGTIEGVWYQELNKNSSFSYPMSFGLLNLRGDALDYPESSSTLASISDVLFIFCDNDMFEDRNTHRKNSVFELIATKLSGKKIQKLILIMTKEVQAKVKGDKNLFKSIAENFALIVDNKTFATVSKKVTSEVCDILKKLEDKSPKALSHRLEQRKKESDSVVNKTFKQVSDSFTNYMNMIHQAGKDDRSKLRAELFPLQSSTKDYAEAQRIANRSRNYQERRNTESKLISIRKVRYTKICNGLPQLMSNFLDELLTTEQSIMFVQNVQYNLDDWCSKHLFDIRRKYAKSLKEINLLRDKATGNRKKDRSESNITKDINAAPEGSKNPSSKVIEKEIENCNNLNKLLLDLSLGIENIFREIGEMREITIRHESELTTKYKQIYHQLPELAATFLIKGIAMELLDGDGLFVPTEWIKEVMKALQKKFKESMNLDKDPNIYVLTILGTQSSGKSTLLNTMFGAQFPVSAGRCTKGAFMQFIPIDIKDYPYNGLFIVDTEGLGAPEHKQNYIHDNEFATFILGISDMALINMRGELPTNMENFLQISTCALMRMSSVDIYPSVAFVHQNCDPSSKVKNISNREAFIQSMDEAVVTQAALNQMQDRYKCFQDVVDMSMENDVFYFTQLLEGAQCMSPPSQGYSSCCSSMVSYVLSKMHGNFKKTKITQTFIQFSEKVERVWDGVLQENFVFSFINSAEIQVKYKIDDFLSIWRWNVESFAEDSVEEVSREIQAHFKSKDPQVNFLSSKLQDLKRTLNERNDDQKKSFLDFIAKQTVNKPMYERWGEQCIKKMGDEVERISECSQRQLQKVYSGQQNMADKEKEFERIKDNLYDHTRETAKQLLLERQRKAGGTNSFSFSDDEIEAEFEKFCSYNVFDPQSIEKRSQQENITMVFYQEIERMYGNAPGFAEYTSRFGNDLKNPFKKEWVGSKHLQFSNNTIITVEKGKKSEQGNADAKDKALHVLSDFSKSVVDLFRCVVEVLQSKVINIICIGKLDKMSFQPDSCTFKCRALVKKYLRKAEDLLNETHNKSPQPINYSLTASCKAIFMFYAAQVAIPNFEQAQISFLKNMDHSSVLNIEKENIKQLFSLILKEEGTLAIAAKQLAKKFHIGVKEAALRQINTPCKRIILSLITQKIHVHGLVLHDVIAMVSDSDANDDHVNYVRQYFQDPFQVFKEKIFHVIEGCSYIKFGAMAKDNFEKVLENIKKLFYNKFKPEKESSLIEVICRDKYIRSLGFGEFDFSEIIMPEIENEKRIEDEQVIIDKLKKLICDAGKVVFELAPEKENEIKEKLVRDISSHLFQCQKRCPLCFAPCNESHQWKREYGTQHYTRCHRPLGFATATMGGSDAFCTYFCNELVLSDRAFENTATNGKIIKFKDYQEVNEYYKSWDIEDVSSEHSLYWKFITFHVMRNLSKYFPEAKKADVSDWDGISETEAFKVVVNIFHLDACIIAKNRQGYHYIEVEEPTN